MKRIHWFEFEDLPSVPAVIRNGATDLLDLMVRRGFYDQAHPHVMHMLQSCGAARVLDVGSGGGGGALALRIAARKAGQSWALTLSDRYPNASGIARVTALGDPATTYRAEPLDVAQLDPKTADAVTMFGALHHFEPDAMRTFIAGLVQQRVSIALVDIVASPAIRRMPAVFLPLLFPINFAFLLLLSLLLTPIVRPVKLTSWLLTYLLPLIPMLFAWDGTVSALRAYTPDEVLEVATSAPGADNYLWTSGSAGKSLYLTGLWRDRKASSPARAVLS